MARSQARFQNFSPGARSLRPVNDALNARGSSLGFADASTNVSRARLVGSCRTDACQSGPARVPWTERVLQQNKSSDTSQTKLLVRLRRRDSKDKICDRPLQTLERAACRNFTFLAEKAAPSLTAQEARSAVSHLRNKYLAPRLELVTSASTSPEPGNRPITLAGPSFDILFISPALGLVRRSRPNPSCACDGLRSGHSSPRANENARRNQVVAFSFAQLCQIFRSKGRFGGFEAQSELRKTGQRWFTEPAETASGSSSHFVIAPDAGGREEPCSRGGKGP